MIAQTYACVAATALGARCRNQAKGEFLVCGLPHTPESPVSPPPDTVFLRFRVNGKWGVWFEVAGLRIIERSAEREVALVNKNAAEAELFDRNPEAIRENCIYSGSPVFGKDGAKNVCLRQTWKELEDAWFVATQAHVLRESREYSSILTLVVEMKQGQVGSSIPTQAMALISGLLYDVWKFAHIWANPPKPEIGTVHTITVLCRLDPRSINGDTVVVNHLLYFSGLWKIATQ